MQNNRKTECIQQGWELFMKTRDSTEKKLSVKLKRCLREKNIVGSKMSKAPVLLDGQDMTQNAAFTARTGH